MKITYKKKSEKTSNRIKEIKQDLNFYRDSIALLNDFKEGRKTLKGGDFVDRAAFYKRTTEDDKRYHWTMKNIKTQMAFLELELEVLYKYGA